MTFLLNPAFYDIFGIFVFVFLIWVSIKLLKGREIKKQVIKLMLIIGILGLIVDLFFVVSNFL